MNHITLIGRLTMDPEMRYFESGANVTYLRIAVDRPRAKENQPQTDYFTIEAWGKLGEIVGEFTRIGHQIAIQGSVHIVEHSSLPNPTTAMAKPAGKPTSKPMRFNF